MLTRASIQLSLSGGLPGRDLLTLSERRYLQSTMMKVGKSDDEETFGNQFCPASLAIDSCRAEADHTFFRTTERL